MAKSQLYNYTFSVSTKKVTLIDITNVSIRKLLAIINATTGYTLYAVGNSALKATLSSNTITLNSSVVTTGMSNSDELLILYDIDVDADIPVVDASAVRNSGLMSFLDSVSTVSIGNADVDVIHSITRFGTDGSTFNNTLKVVSVNPGNVYEIMCLNPTPDILYLKFYDAIAGDNPVVGATVPSYIYIIPPQQVITTAVSGVFATTGTTTVPGMKELIDNGLKKLSFTRGCQVSIVKGVTDSDNTAPAASCVLQLKHYF